MEDDNKKRYDYFLYHLFGKSTDEINKMTRGGEVELLPYEEAKQRYLAKNGTLAGMPEEEFAKRYQSATEGYKQYSQNKFNGYLADKWIYGDPSRMLMGGENVMKPDADLGGMVQGRPGFDMNGMRTMSDQEIAEQRGEIKGLGGKIRKYDKPGFFGSMLKLLPDVSPDVFYKPIVTLDYDKEGNPLYTEKLITDPGVKRQQIIGAWGAIPLQESWLSTGAKSLYNSLIPTLYSTIGSSMEIADNLYDMIANGKNINSRLETLGRTIQNEAGVMTMGVSQEAQQQPFTNVPSTVNAIMQVAGQLLTVQAAQVGVRATIRVASALMENYITSFGVFGAMSADGYMQAGKAMGIDPLRLASEAVIVGGIEGLTETILGPKLVTRGFDYVMSRKAIREIAIKELSGNLKEAGVKTVSELTESQRKVGLKKVISGIAKYYDDVIKNPGTRMGRILSIATEEGEEEAVANPLQNMVQTVNDYLALKDDPNAKPGEGMFNEYDPSIGLAGNMAKQAPQGLWQGYVLGFFGGAIGGVGQFRSKIQDNNLSQYIAEGKEGEIYKALEIAHKANMMGEDFLDEKGNVITSDKKGKVSTQNDFAYEQAKNKIQYMAELRDKYGLRSPQALDAVANDVNWVKEGLTYAKDIEAKKDELKTILGKQEQTQVDQVKIKELTDGIAFSQQKLNEIILPENEGQLFSKAYNDKLKNEYARIDAIDTEIRQTFKDKGITPPVKGSDQYNAFFQIRYDSGMYDNLYDTYRDSNIEKQKYEQVRLQQNEAIRKTSTDNEESISKVLSGVQTANIDLSTNITSAKKIKEQMAHTATLINQSIASANITNLKQKAIESFNVALEDLNKKLSERSNLIDDENLTKEDLALRTDINNIIPELSNAYSQITTASPNIKLQDDFTEDYYYKDIEKALEDLDEKKKNDFADTDLKSEEANVNKLIGRTQRNIDVLRVGGELLKNPVVKNHLSTTDEPITDNITNDGTKSLKISLSKLDGLNKDIETALKNDSAYQQKRELVESNLSKYVLLKMTDIFQDEKFVELVKSIEEFDDIIKNSPDISPKVRNILSENHRKVLQARKMIFDNKKILLTKQNLTKLLDGKSYTSLQIYFKAKDFISNDYLDDLMGIGQTELLTNDTGYVYLMNFIFTSIGIDPMTLHNGRIKYLSDTKNIKDKLSTYEQMRSSDLIVSFLNNEDNFLADTFNTLLEIEQEHPNKITSSSALKVMYARAMDNVLFVRGEFRTGKTKQIGAEAFKILSYISDTKHTLGLVGISLLNLNDLYETFRGINNLTLDYFPTNQIFQSKSIRDKINAYDYLVWDEASLINNNETLKIKEYFNQQGVRMVFLGDDSQMNNNRGISNGNFAEELGIRTNPVMKKYSSDVPLIDDVARTFKHTNIRTPMRELPLVYDEVDSQGDRRGVRYYTKLEDVIGAFIQSEKPDKALVILEDDKDIRKELKDKYGISEDNKNVFKIKMDITKPTGKDELTSIQGQRRGEVYVAISYPDILMGANISNTEEIRRAMYTATSRSNGFLALIGNEQMNTVKENVNWKDTTPEQTDRDLSDAKKRLLEQLKSQSGFSYTMEPKVQQEVPVTPKKAKTKKSTTTVEKKEEAVVDITPKTDNDAKTGVWDVTTERSTEDGRQWDRGNVYTRANTTIGIQGTTEKYSVNERVESNIFLSRLEGRIFDAKLVYLPIANYFDGQKLQQKSNVLAVRLSVKSTKQKEFNKIVEGKDTPRIIKEILKDRKFEDSGLDYVLQLMDPKKDVQGDKNVMDLHEHLFGLINKGKKKYLASKDPVIYLDDEISLDCSDGFRTRVDNTIGFDIPWETVKKDMGSQGWVFGTPVIETTSKNTVTPAIHLDYKKSPGKNSSYIIIRKKKLSELTDKVKYLTEKFNEDKTQENGVIKHVITNNKNEGSIFGTIKDRTWLFNFINRNRSIIRKPQYKDFERLLTKYGYWRIDDAKIPHFDLSGNFAEQQDNYANLFSTMIKHINMLGIDDLEIPYIQKAGSKEIDTDIQNEDEKFLSMHNTASYSFTYVKFNKNNSSPTYKEIGSRSQTNKKNIDVSNLFTDADIPNKHTQFSSLKEVEQYFTDLFHPSIWNQIKKDGIVPILTYNGRELAGQMYNGKIKLRLFDQGIKSTSPKHEAFHLVFNYFINPDSKSILFAEAKDAMIANGEKGTITDIQAEEWMARKYASTEKVSPWYTPKGILQRFMNFLDTLYEKIVNGTPNLNDLMWQINTGKYKGFDVNIADDGATILRNEDIDLQEEEDLGESITGDSYRDHYYDKVPQIFIRTEIITNIKKRIGNHLNTFTNLHNMEVDESGSPDLSAYSISFPEAYKQFETNMFYEDVDGKMTSKETLYGDTETEYGLLKNITGEQILSLPSDIQEKYVEYHLSNEKTLRSFVKNIFPSMDFDTFMPTKYNQSTQYKNKNAYNPDQSKTDFIRWQYEITPLYEFEGKKVVKQQGYIDARELEISLNLAARNLYNRLKIEENVDPFDIFQEELIKIANIVEINNNKRDTILSFINKFLDSMDDTTYDLRTLSNAWINSKDLATRERAMDIDDFLRSVVLHHMSLHSPTNSYTKITGKKADPKLKLVVLSNVSEENEKNKIIENIKNEVYTNGIVKEWIQQRYGFGEKKYQTFDVKEDGLYYVKGEKDTKKRLAVLKVENGKVIFAEGFKNANIRKEFFKTIGLHLTNQVVQDMSLGRSIDLNEVLKRKSTLNKNVDTSEFLGDLLMNMAWSLYSNINSTTTITSERDKLNVLKEKNPDKEIESTKEGKAILSKIEDAEKNPLFKTQMAPFRKDMMITRGTTDSQTDIEGSEDNIFLPKPTDYFKAFEALGMITLYAKGLGSSTFFMNPKGRRIYNNQLHSAHSMVFENGSKPIRDEFQGRLLAKEINPSISELYDGTNVLNLLYAKNGIELLSTQDFQGLRTDFTGEDTPVVKDLHDSMFNAWFNGVKDVTSEWQKQIFGSTIPGDKKLKFNEFDFFPGQKKNYITVGWSGDKVSDVTIEESFINKAIETEFLRQKHAHILSKGRWMEFAKSTTLKLPEWLTSGKMNLADDTFNDTAKKFTLSLDAIQMGELSSSDLWANKDYIIQKGSNNLNGYTITLGNNTLWNVENFGEVYSFKNFMANVDSKNRFKLSTETRDKYFTSAYKEFASKLSGIGFKLPEEIKELLSNNGYYRTSDGTKTGSIIEYNNIMKAFFYGYHIANTALSNIDYGSVEELKNPLNKAKYAASAHTPGNLMDLNNKYGLPPIMKEIVIENMFVTDPNTNLKIQIADGIAWYGALANSFLSRSIGGRTYGFADECTMKPINTGSNRVTGIYEVRKEMNDSFSNTLFLQNMIVRKMNREMMDHTDIEVRKLNPEYDISLWSKFEDFWSKDLDRPMKAMDKLRDWIVDESGYGTEIKRNLVQAIRNASCHKAAVNRVNQYDTSSIQPRNDLKVRDIDNRNTRYSLNPHQAIADHNRLAPPMQGDSLYGIGSWNHDTGIAIRSILNDLYLLGDAKMKVDIYGRIELTDEKERVDKLLEYLAKKGTNIVRAMNNPENFAQLLMDKEISKELPQVMEVLRKAYCKEINSIIKPNMTGLRMVQSSGTVITHYYKDGIPYTLNEVETELRNAKYFEGRKIKILDVGEIPDGYTSRTLDPMLRGDEITTKAKVVSPFIYRNEFGLSATDNVNDVYTLYFKKQTGIAPLNLRNHTIEQIQTIISDAIKQGIVDADRTICIREGSNWGGYDNYLASFKKCLTVLASRVPMHKLGSGLVGEIVSFADDNGNTLYFNPIATIYGDDDFDVDQRSVYFYAIEKTGGTYKISGDINKKEGLDNAHLDIIVDTYLDKKNQDILFSASTTSNIDKKADNIKVSTLNKDNDYASALNIYNIAQQGADSIGIIVNSLSAFAYLRQIDPAKAKELLKNYTYIVGEGDDFSPTSIIKSFEGFVQSILDNLKKFAIGRFGITEHSINILSSMIIEKKSLDEIVDFFKQPIIQEVFNQVSIGDQVQESKKNYEIFKIIDDSTVKINKKEESDLNVEEIRTKIGEIINQGVEDLKLIGNDVSSLPLQKIEEEVKNYLSSNNEEKYKELNTLIKSISIIRQREWDIKNNEKLSELKKYAQFSQALYRFSRIIGLRGGIERDDFASDGLHYELQNYLGQPLESYIDGRTTTLAQHIDWFKEHNNEYLKLGNNQEEKTRILENEVAIWSILDLQNIVRSYPHFLNYLKAFNSFKEDKSKITWEQHPLMKYFEKTYFDLQKIGWYNFRDQFNNMKKLKNEFLLDYFFKKFYSEKSFNLETDKGDATGLTGAYSSLKLDSRDQRHLFVNQFTRMHDWIKSIAFDMSPSDGIDALTNYLRRPGISEEELSIEVEKAHYGIFGNKLIDNMITDGRDDASFVRLNDYNMNANRVAMYAMEFSKLPKWLQDMEIFNEFINNGFGYRKSSLMDIMGKDIYKRSDGLTMAIEMFKGDLDNIYNDPDIINKVTERFLETLFMNKNMVPYLSEIDKANEYKPYATIKYVRYGQRVLPQVHFLINETYEIRYLKSPRGGFDSGINNVSKYQYVAMDPMQVEKMLSTDNKVEITYWGGHGYKVGEMYLNGAGQVITPQSTTYSTVTWKKVKASEKQLSEIVEKISAKSAEQIKVFEDEYKILDEKFKDGTASRKDVMRFHEMANQLINEAMHKEITFDTQALNKVNNGEMIIKC